MNQHVQTAVHFATVEGRVLAAALKPACFVVERRHRRHGQRWRMGSLRVCPCVDADRSRRRPGRRRSWVASAQPSRRRKRGYYLNGVCWSVGRWFAATDGHRLFKLNYSTDDGPEVKHIIPRKVVLLLAKFLAGADVTVFAVKGRASLHFVADGVTVRAKMIEGTYPDIDRVIPKRDAVRYTLELQADAITSALRQVTVLRSLRSGRAVRLFNKDGEVAIEVKNVDAGDVTAVLHGTAWPIGASDFGLNRDYLKAMVGTCSDVVRVGMTDAGAPVLISDNDDTLIRVQMPMRV